MNKSFTLGEFVDNIEKNGLPQSHGTLFTAEYGNGLTLGYGEGSRLLPVAGESKIIAACAFGQGLINQGVIPFENDSSMAVNFGHNSLLKEIYEEVWDMNDNALMNYKEIVEKLRTQYEDYLDVEFELPEFDYSPYL